MKQSHTFPEWSCLITAFFVLLAFRAWLMQAAALDMHFDEAQYWTWSQHPDWSYATKGPLVAWLIAASEWLFGHGDWQARLPAWIAGSLFPLLLYAFSRQLWCSRAAGWWALLLGTLTPLYFVLGMVVTNDIFLFLFWGLGLWAAYQALIRQQRLAWYGLGVAVGLGMLTKLSIGLLPAAIGLWVLVHPDYRHHLKNPHVWGGVLSMLLIASPILLWNLQHDWVMFRHNAGHVSHGGWSLLRLGEFLLGQWMALSPLVVAVAVWRLWRRPEQAAGRLLWSISLGCLIFFGIKAFSGSLNINWPAPIYIGFILLLAGQIESLSKLQRRLFLSGHAVSVLLLVFTFFPALFGFAESRIGLKKLRAWQEPVQQLAEQAGHVDYLMVPNYHLASELWFYWPEAVRVYLWGDPQRRFNQFDIWPGVQVERGGTSLYVSDRSDMLQRVAADFDHCNELPPVPCLTRDGGVVRTLLAMRCEGFRPTEQISPKTY
jgi:undecaprenyl-diphosphatase